MTSSEKNNPDWEITSQNLRFNQPFECKHRILFEKIFFLKWSFGQRCSLQLDSPLSFCYTCLGSELSSFIYLQQSYNSGDATSASQDLNVDKPGEEGQFSHSNGGLRSSQGTPHLTSIDTTEHNQEQYVCDMKVDGCYYTGQIDHESKSPHGSGKLRSEDGTMLEAEWKWGCCSFDV